MPKMIKKSSKTSHYLTFFLFYDIIILEINMKEMNNTIEL